MKLRPYQARACRYLRSQQRVLLIAPIGAGKTAITLRALPAGARTLVLGTLRIARDVWPREAAIWAPKLKVAVAAGLPREKREAALNEDAGLVTLNYENLPWLLEHGVPAFDVLVMDEITKGKDPRSVTHKCLRELAARIGRRIGLTGSPAANHLYDLWGQAYLIDEGKALGRYRSGFLTRHFLMIDNGRWVTWVPRPGAMQEITRALRGTAHIVSDEELERDLPALNVVTHELALDPTVERMQKQAEALRRRAGDVTVEGVQLMQDGLRILTRYLQLALGSVYDEEEQVRHLHRAKYDMLEELLDGAQEPVMIVYQYQHELVEIAALLRKRRWQHAVLTGGGAEASRVVDAWNADRLDALLVHPKSCGHGLNLQFSRGRQQVWLAPPPTCDAELFVQTVGRLRRPRPDGSRPPVTVHRIVMRGTADEAAWRLIDAKERSEQALHAALDSVLGAS